MASTTERASDFLNSLGVNTHIPYTDGGYANISNIASDLKYLGITNIRDTISDGSGGSAPLSSYISLAQQGIKFTVLLNTGGNITTADLTSRLSLIKQLIAAVPGSVTAVEGPNEINNWPVTFNGVSGLQGAVDLQKALYSAVHGDAAFQGVSVDYFTGYGAGGIANGPDPSTTAGLADYDTQHPYPNNENAPMQWINRTQALQNESSSNSNPAVYTETGYTTNQVSADVDAKYTLDLYMDAASIGVKQTDVYQLMDAYQPGSPQGDDGFGLFDPSNAPKEVATDIHNLTTILADNGATASTFTPTKIDYTVSGAPTTGTSMEISKSNGATDIVTWAEPEIANGLSEIQAPTFNETIQLGATYGKVEIFDPTKGTTAIQTLTNISSVTVGVTDHPLIIEVEPGSAAPVTLSITPSVETASTVGTTTAHPFSGVAIADTNASQTETAKVSLSVNANGTISDPNASTDGSSVSNGVLTVSGSAAAVAKDLDGLVFTPAASAVANGPVQTTITAALTDSAGDTASTGSTITSTHVASASGTQVDGTTGVIYDASGNAWSITSGQQIAMNGNVIPSSKGVLSLVSTGSGIDQLNNVGDWWTQPLDGSAGTKLTGAPAGYVAPSGNPPSTPTISPITITSTTAAVSDTAATTANPFSGVVVGDTNANQTETVSVSVSSVGNTTSMPYGVISDPNASADGSSVSNGVLTVSGSAAAVAKDLDGLVFTPDASAVANGPVQTTITAALTDSAGQTASVASTVTTDPVAPSAISITPATESVSTSGTAAANPFAGVAITDANASQTETANVSLSSTSTGALADPNASTDGSSVSNGILTVSGSAAAVAKDLDGLVFTPSAGMATAAAAQTTTVVAAITDTAGETASASSMVTATPPVTTPPVTTPPVTTPPVTTPPVTTPPSGSSPVTYGTGSDSLVLGIKEDAYNGDAEFKVSVDGKQVGGTFTATTLNTASTPQTFTLNGNWGAGKHTVGVDFINDKYNAHVGDRNLYVDSVSYDGNSNGQAPVELYRNGSKPFTVSSGGSTNPTPPTQPTPPVTTKDAIDLNLSADVYNGDPNFTMLIDGKAVMGPTGVAALETAGKSQDFAYSADLGAGNHTLSVVFSNDLYAGTASTDRNLYVNGFSVNGTHYGMPTEMRGNGTDTFAFTTTH